MAAADLIAKLAGLYAAREAPDVDQRLASFWWGAEDEEVAWALALANSVQDEPIAERLYVAHAAEDTRHSRQIKDWAYRLAVDFALSKRRGERIRANVEGYRVEWGHQAARDGLALALWKHLADEVPGIGKRAEQFRCGKQGYQRIRDEVQRQAGELLTGYRMDFEQAMAGRFSRDFLDRWEQKSGRLWPRGL